MKRHVPIAALLLVFGLLAGPASSELPDDLNRALDRLEGWGLSGAVLQGQAGETRVDRGLGKADRKAGKAFSTETRIPWHSVSKSATAALLLRLEQADQLSLDDPLHRHFEQLPRSHGEIRIEQLLTHTSGLAAQLAHPDHEGPPEFEDIDRQELESRAFASEPMAAPGSAFRYSNLGYNLAAAVAERAGEDDFASLLSEQVLEPAGLGETGIGALESSSREAVGYQDGRSWGRFSERAWSEGQPGWNLMGSGAVAGPAREMAGWIQALRTDGPLDAEQRRRWQETRVDKQEGRGYALGWSTVEDTPAGKRIGHEGGFGPFTSKLAWWPEPDQWLAVSLNSNRFHAVDVVAGLETLIGGQDRRLPPEPGHHPLPEPWAALPAEWRYFTGTGGNEWRVRRQDDTLVVEAFGPEAVAPIAWPEGVPEELGGIAGELMSRLRGLAQGEGRRPSPRDREERETMRELGEWLDKHRDLPVQGLCHLGIVPHGDGSELAAHVALEDDTRMRIHMDRDGHWRGLETDVEAPPARAVYRARQDGESLHGIETTRLEATREVRIEADRETAKLHTREGLQLSCSDCAAKP